MEKMDKIETLCLWRTRRGPERYHKKTKKDVGEFRFLIVRRRHGEGRLERRDAENLVRRCDGVFSPSSI